MLLPPDPRAEFNGSVLEDFRIGSLLDDVAISRNDWSLAYDFAISPPKPKM